MWMRVWMWVWMRVWMRVCIRLWMRGWMRPRLGCLVGARRVQARRHPLSLEWVWAAEACGSGMRRRWWPLWACLAGTQGGGGGGGGGVLVPAPALPPGSTRCWHRIAAAVARSPPPKPLARPHPLSLSVSSVWMTWRQLAGREGEREREGWGGGAGRLGYSPPLQPVLILCLLVMLALPPPPPPPPRFLSFSQHHHPTVSTAQVPACTPRCARPSPPGSALPPRFRVDQTRPEPRNGTRSRPALFT